jgi:limonene-1,2-epoxide hydrolase
MSQENIERVRAIIDAYSRGDFDAAQEITDSPDFVLVPPGGQSEIRGAAQIRVWMEPDAFESQTVEPLDFRTAGTKVLVRTRNRIRGAGSGIEIEFFNWGVWTFDEAGRPVRLEVYLAHEEAQAMRAAGLRP